MKKILLILTSAVMLAASLASCKSEKEKELEVLKKNDTGKYTVYGDVDIAMDIKVSDYLKTEGEQEIYCFDKVINDMGWKSLGTSHTPNSYIHEFDDMNVFFNYVDAAQTDTNNDKRMIEKMRLTIRTNDAGTDLNAPKSYIDFENKDEDLAYRIDDTDIYISYDEAVVMTYLLWSGVNNKGVDPFNDKFDNDSPYRRYAPGQYWFPAKEDKAEEESQAE